MEKFNHQTEAQNLVRFDSMSELVNSWSRLTIVWSWGARGYTNIGNKFLKFRVSGHHHKGYVFIGVNGLDLFNIYIVSIAGNLKEKIENVYLEDLIHTIDVRIEKIDDYKF
jgi:hypothetical protein